MATERHRRQSHVKSKQGCLTCKNRHVRCDERHPECFNCTRRGLKCNFSVSSQQQTTPQLPEMDNIVTYQKDVTAASDPSTLSFENLPIFQHPSLIQRIEDLRMTHHTSQIITELQKNGGHRLAFGTSVLPAFLELTVKHEFVRYALIGLGTAHLNSLVKSPELSKLGLRYARTACSGLQSAMRDFSKENADGVLATSMLLGWQATNGTTYAKFMQGVTQIVNAMRPWEDESQLLDLLRDTSPLTGRMRESLAQYSTYSEDSLYNLQPLVDTLDRLEHEVRDRKELRDSARSYSDFIRSLQNSPLDLPPSKQFELVYPIKTWLPYMPSTFIAIGTRDIWPLVCMAFYHTIYIAAAMRLPAITKPTFTIKRTETILRIDGELRAINATSHDAKTSIEVQKAIDIMRLALVYVVDYRLRFCKIKE